MGIILNAEQQFIAIDDFDKIFGIENGLIDENVYSITLNAVPAIPQTAQSARIVHRAAEAEFRRKRTAVMKATVRSRKAFGILL